MFARFVIYGALGWIVEILWTGLGSVLRRDPRLRAQTYLWMFPIYGGGALLLETLLPYAAAQHWFVRGLIWVVTIYVVEYATGWVLRRFVGRSPWDYTGSSFAIDGLIRLDYAPAWFVLSLLFERIHPLVAHLAAAVSAMINS